MVRALQEDRQGKVQHVRVRTRAGPLHIRGERSYNIRGNYSRRRSFHFAYDRRCSTTAKLLEDLVKVFCMSHKDKDFIFCGQRVQAKDTETIVSQEHASKSLELLGFASRRAEPSTPLLRGEHTAFRSLLGQLPWLQIQTRPELSFDVNKCAQRSAAPTIEDARYINAVARRAHDSPKARLRYVRVPIDIPTCTLLSYNDAAFANMEGEKNQYGVIIFASHRPKEFWQGQFQLGSLLF